MTKFEVGKKYYCYSPYNSDRPYEFEVVKRTEKMVTVKNSDGEIKRRKIDTRDNEEIIYPNGKYSMCLVLGSNHVVTETEEKIKNMKYQWTNSVTEPADNTFTENCKDGDTITKNNVTGTYYLWILLETESGATAKRRSEAFNFDNEGPSITTFTTTKYSETGITLSATATDNKSGAVKFEFYVDNVLKGTETCSATTSNVTKSKTITGLSTGSHNCKVIVYDAKNNSSNKTVAGTTKLYTWEKWDVIKTPTVQVKANSLGTQHIATLSQARSLLVGKYIERTPVTGRYNSRTFPSTLSKIYRIDSITRNRRYTKDIIRQKLD